MLHCKQYWIVGLDAEYRDTILAVFERHRDSEDPRGAGTETTNDYKGDYRRRID